MHKWKTKRPNGMWYCCWKTGVGDQAKVSRMSLHTKSAKEANKLIRLPLSALKTRLRPTKRGRVVTVQDIVLKWIEFKTENNTKGLGKETLEQYERLGRTLGGMRPKNIKTLTRKDVVEWVMETWKEKPVTSRNRLNLFVSVVKWAINEFPTLGLASNVAIVARDQFADPEPTHREPVDGRLLAAVITELRDYPAREVEFRELADQLEIQWYSGLRCTEIARLSWDDILWGSEMWTIRSPKNKGGITTLPMHPRIVEILTRLRRTKDESKPIFASARRTQSRWRIHEKRSENARKINRGGIRHAFITQLRRQGEHTAAKGLARHSAPSMTDIYTHVAENEYRNALTKVPPIAV